MKILLIEPPPTHKFGNLRALGSVGRFKADTCWPPIDLMFLSGALTKLGVENEIYDAHALRADYDDVKAVIKKTKPQMVIFDVTTSTLHHDLQTATVAKQVSADIVTVAFGVHIIALPEETIKSQPALDIAVTEEPELPIISLVKNEGLPEEVSGIYYRQNGDIIKNPSSGRVAEDLDSLGLPAHDKIPLERYFDPTMKRRPMSMTMVSRGCINSCIYCPSSFFKFRLRSVASTIEELKWAVDLGIKEMRFFDMGFTNNLKWAEDVTERMIDEKIDLSWLCTCRADRVNENILRQMKAAGCHKVHFGMESTDRSILKTIKKNIVPEQVAEAVGLCKKTGLRTLVSFLVGLPGDTPESVQKTIDFSKEIDPDYVSWGIATPQPGKEFYNYLKEYNYFRDDVNWTDFDPLKKPVYEYPGLSTEEMLDLKNKALKDFYFRPSYIWRRFINQRDWLEMKNNWRNFVGFMKRYVLS